MGRPNLTKYGRLSSSSSVRVLSPVRFVRVSLYCYVVVCIFVCYIEFVMDFLISLHDAYYVKAWIPVIARPRMRVWISYV
jgi:hypothetical protein